jgi:hypothetical protein
MQAALHNGEVRAEASMDRPNNERPPKLIPQTLNMPWAAMPALTE